MRRYKTNKGRETNLWLFKTSYLGIYARLLMHRQQTEEYKKYDVELKDIDFNIVKEVVFKDCDKIIGIFSEDKESHHLIGQRNYFAKDKTFDEIFTELIEENKNKKQYIFIEYKGGEFDILNYNKIYKDDGITIPIFRNN